MFHVGQKVLCVNDSDSPSGYRGRVTFPYAARLTPCAPSFDARGWDEDGADLAEIVNLHMRLLTSTVRGFGAEVAFRLSAVFGPLCATNIHTVLEMLEAGAGPGICSWSGTP